MEKRICPKCKQDASDQTFIKGPDKEPVPGNLMICLYCQALLQFTMGNSLVEITKEQVAELYKMDPGLREDIFKVRMAAYMVMQKKQQNQN